jgi:hypothetical protein
VAHLTAAKLLEFWEWGRGLHPIDRTLRLVALTRPDLLTSELADLTLGDRDTALLALHEELFGSHLPCVADCPGCGERLEFDLSTANLWSREAAPKPPEVMHAGRTLRVRPLNSHDLAAVADACSADEARRLLAQRSLVDDCDVELSDELVDALAERLADIDPRAEALLDLTCPTCRQTWQRSLDVESYLWSEISAEALRLLSEVHTLARTYGWREADILAMSATRRQAYSDLAG